MIPVFYDGPKIAQSLLQKKVSDNTVENLRHDLGTIAKMYGPMTFDPDCFDEVNKDIENGIPPEPTAPHLAEYNQRRISHHIKVAMSVSAARRGTRKIMLEDWEYTKELMRDMEKHMPKALEGFGMGRTGKIAYDMTVWLNDTLFANGRSHLLIKHFKRELLRKIPNPGELTQTIQAMEDSGYIKVEGNLVFPCRNAT
jgi:hypothetical protein